jgi:hypothetical protein
VLGLLGLTAPDSGPVSQQQVTQFQSKSPLDHSTCPNLIYYYALKGFIVGDFCSWELLLDKVHSTSEVDQSQQLWMLSAAA